VYTLGRASLKPARKQWNHLNSDYEITLENGRGPSRRWVRLCPSVSVRPLGTSIHPRRRPSIRPIQTVHPVLAIRTVHPVGPVHPVHTIPSVVYHPLLPPPRSELELVAGDTSDIPKMSYRFTKIASLEAVEPGKVVDLIAIVEAVEPWTEINLRSGGTTQKRNVQLRDDSGAQIELAVWGALATGDVGTELEAAAASKPVVALKAVKVGDFGGRTLSTIGSTVIDLQPDLPEATPLRAWYDGGGGAAQATKLSGGGGGGGEASAAQAHQRRATVSMIEDEGLAADGQTVWTTCLATVSFLRGENLSYPACTGTGPNGKQCNKKLSDSGFCERCGVTCDRPEHRYIASVQVSDFSGARWATAFQEQGATLLGVSADDLAARREAGQDGAVLKQALWQHRRLRLKVAQDTYQDETKIKLSFQDIHPVSYAYEARVCVCVCVCVCARARARARAC